MRRIVAALIAALLWAGAALAAGGILPQGVTQFTDNNGAPLAGGKVFFYQSQGSTVLKDTYQDAGLSVVNANPVPLDIGGRAVIFGSGTYWQVVQDINGTQIWAGATQDPLSGAGTGVTAWLCTTKGSANAQTQGCGPNFKTGFANADGQEAIFIAGFTNTAGMTLDAGTGPIGVVVDTPQGQQVASAGTVLQGNTYTAVYDKARGAFHIRTPAVQAAVQQIPSGAVMAYAGGTLPSGWLWADGGCYNVATYPSLYGALGTLYGNCGSGTFRVPDARERVLAGWSPNGSPGRLTGATMGSVGLSGVGGAETTVLTQGELPSVTLGGTTSTSVTFPGLSYTAPSPTTSPSLGTGGASYQQFTTVSATTGGAGPTLFPGSASVALGGSGTATPIVQPTIMVGYIIKQ